MVQWTNRQGGHTLVITMDTEKLIQRLDSRIAGFRREMESHTEAAGHRSLVYGDPAEDFLEESRCITDLQDMQDAIRKIQADADGATIWPMAVLDKDGTFRCGHDVILRTEQFGWYNQIRRAWSVEALCIRQISSTKAEIILAHTLSPNHTDGTRIKNMNRIRNEKEGKAVEEMPVENVTLHGVQEPDRLAGRVLQAYGYENCAAPVPVVEIAGFFGIKVYKEPGMPDGVPGRLYIGGTTQELYHADKAIIVREDAEYTQQRFVVACGLAHCLMDYAGSRESAGTGLLFSRTYPSHDRRTDCFARSLLMPERPFMREYIKVIRAAMDDEKYMLPYLVGRFNVEENSAPQWCAGKESGKNASRKKERKFVAAAPHVSHNQNNNGYMITCLSFAGIGTGYFFLPPGICTSDTMPMMEPGIPTRMPTRPVITFLQKWKAENSHTMAVFSWMGSASAPALHRRSRKNVTLPGETPPSGGRKEWKNILETGEEQYDVKEFCRHGAGNTGRETSGKRSQGRGDDKKQRHPPDGHHGQAGGKQTGAGFLYGRILRVMQSRDAGGENRGFHPGGIPAL